MPNKYYAVRKGRRTGIFETWDECKKSVNGYAGAIYKSFVSMTEAERYLNEDKSSYKPHSLCYAYVDGSFNADTGAYGYGGFLMNKGDKIPLQGNGHDPDMISMRNVSGEILGSIAAIKKAFSLGIMDIDVYFDYKGIQKWADHEWKTNKEYTAQYQKYIDFVRNHGMLIHFIKVAGHTGVEGNEEADKMAKRAVGNPVL